MVAISQCFSAYGPQSSEDSLKDEIPKPYGRLSGCQSADGVQESAVLTNSQVVLGHFSVLRTSAWLFWVKGIISGSVGTLHQHEANDGSNMWGNLVPKASCSYLVWGPIFLISQNPIGHTNALGGSTWHSIHLWWQMHKIASHIHFAIWLTGIDWLRSLNKERLMDLSVKWGGCVHVSSCEYVFKCFDFLSFHFIHLIHQLAPSQVWLLKSVGHAYSFNQFLAFHAPIFFSEHLYKTSTCLVCIL